MSYISKAVGKTLFDDLGCYSMIKNMFLEGQ